jgi:ankyrin repeat protein
MLCNENNNTDYDNLKLLLKQPNININLQNNIGESALILACNNQNDDLSTIELLVEQPNIDFTLKTIYMKQQHYNYYILINLNMTKKIY